MLLIFSCIVTASVAPLLDMRRGFKAVMDVVLGCYDSLWYLSFAVGGACLFNGIGFFLLVLLYPVTLG